MAGLYWMEADCGKASRKSAKSNPVPCTGKPLAPNWLGASPVKLKVPRDRKSTRPLFRSLLDGGGLRQGEQKIGEIESGSLYGQAVGAQLAGGLAGEVQGAASVLLGFSAEIVAAILHA